MNETNKIWITWETQRRSIELAKQFNCKFHKFEYSGIFRYPKCIYKTLKVLFANKPDITFVQNPSMILAALICIYKKKYKTKLVVDRHTTFMINKNNNLTIANIVFKTLHRFTIKNADLTIITNYYLARIVEEMGGKALILPDKLPELKPTKYFKVKDGLNILLISSYGEDEPIEEVFKAMDKLKNNSTTLYVSGDCKKLKKQILINVPPNVELTGYLPEEEYVNLMCSVDAVMALTTSDYCML